MLGHRVIEGLGVLAWLVCEVGFMSHLLACVSGQVKSSDRTVFSSPWQLRSDRVTEGHGTVWPWDVPIYLVVMRSFNDCGRLA